MAISQAMCTSFKVECLTGTHVFGTDVFKLALYTSAATLDASTTAYTSTNEVGASGSYSAGGGTLTLSTTPTSSGTTAYLNFSDISFTAATITARGALIYNSSKGNKAVVVLDFGADKTSTAGTFTVQMPAATNTTAVVRIA